MAVTSTVYTEAYMQYYSNNIPNCLKSGEGYEDYKLLGKGNSTDVYLYRTLDLRGLSSACTVSSIEVYFDSGMFLNNGSHTGTPWYDYSWAMHPYFYKSFPTISGAEVTVPNSGTRTSELSEMKREFSGGWHRNHYEIWNESFGNPAGLFNGGDNGLIAFRITLQNKNYNGNTRVTLANFRITVTRTRACYVTFKGEGIEETKTKYDFGSRPSRTVERAGYAFVGWKSPQGTVYQNGSLPTAGETDITYTAVWSAAKPIVAFVNTDGSLIKSTEVDSGSTLGTLPELMMNGYTFEGWYAGSSYGYPAVYNGGNYIDLGINYPKYSDKFSVHIEAYKENWSTMGANTEQIVSCAQGGGWNIGKNAGNGAEAYISGTGWKSATVDFNLSPGWHTFDMWFDGSKIYSSVDGGKATSVSAPGTVSYANNIHLLIGTEAGDSSTIIQDETRFFFVGSISNLIYANVGTQLEKATKDTIISNDTTYYPIWRKIQTVKATFKNWNGDILQAVDVEKGKTPSYTGSTPTRASTAQYSYTFKGWSPSVGAISEDTVYTAQFTQTVRSYAIKFVNHDGTVLQNTNVQYGTTPSYTGATPTKPSNDQYSYSFSGWSPSISSVNGSATYTAQFTQTVRSYVITFVNYDDTVLKSNYVEYGSMPQPPSNPTKPSTDLYRYEFNKWSPDIKSVTGSATYKATFNEIAITYSASFTGVNCSVDKRLVDVTPNSTVTVTITPDSMEDYYAVADYITDYETTYSVDPTQSPFTWTTPAITRNTSFIVYCTKHERIKILNISMIYSDRQIGSIVPETGRPHSVPVGEGFIISVEAT